MKKLLMVVEIIVAIVSIILPVIGQSIASIKVKVNDIKRKYSA